MLKSIGLACLVFVCGTSLSTGQSLLGGGASQYFKLWANPESESYVRYLFRLSTNIRFDRNIVMQIDQHKDNTFVSTLLNTDERELPDAAIM